MSADLQRTTTGRSGHVERTMTSRRSRSGTSDQPKPLPRSRARPSARLPSIDTVIEGKTLLATARTGAARGHAPAWRAWTGEGQVFFSAKGDRMWIGCPLTSASRRQGQAPAGGAITHSYDFGVYKISLDGRRSASGGFLRPADRVKEQNLGDRELARARVLQFGCVGVNQIRSAGRPAGEARDRFGAPCGTGGM